jgi:hypothetical protein
MTSEDTDLLIEELQTLTSTTSDPCFVMGDFNFPNIDWDVPRPTDTGGPSAKFLECVQGLGLEQLVCEPTRGKNILDLILCTNPRFVHSVDVCCPINSDHAVVRAKVIVGRTAPSKTEPRRAFHLAHYDAIAEFLDSIDWVALANDFQTAKEFWKVILCTLEFCMENFVPRTISAERMFLRKNKNIKTKMRRLQRLYKRLGCTLAAEACPAYQRLQSEIRTAKLTEDLKEEKRVLDKGDSKSFFAFVNRKMTSQSSIPALKNGNDLLISDTEKAQAFGDYFSSVFTEDNGEMPNLNSRVAADVPKLMSVIFTPVKVERAMTEMSTKMSSGPDHIPSGFVRKLSPQLCEPLSMLFNRCMAQGILPDVWLEAIVIPVFKKGSRSQVGNYRPISLTSVICKIMERVIKDEILAYLETHRLLSENQHGFRTGRSTTTQLLSCLNQWTDAINSGDFYVDVAYLDYRKAFDSVVHSKLLAKLSAFGISGELLNFCAAFLSGRTQRVQIGDTLSEPMCVKSGVPQGSVLGPLFFIMYIDDIDHRDIVKSSDILMYADDTKLSHLTRRGSFPEGLQADLNRVDGWSTTWQLSLSKEKCSIVRFSSRASDPPTISIGGTDLDEERRVRDLGIMLCPNLHFKDHIFHIVGKAYQRLNLILSVFVCKDMNFLVLMYVTYVGEVPG